MVQGNPHQWDASFVSSTGSQQYWQNIPIEAAADQDHNANNNTTNSGNVDDEVTTSEICSLLPLDKIHPALKTTTIEIPDDTRGFKSLLFDASIDK